ncbi:lantibiotic dehydratase [Nonomuraea insulae]|uniref:Lantibiotic dehydratase n=1 Tax=Nonomuraea insulae TaxID=1616787 RepID=A0ABW1CKQ4_9ACTN
MSGTGMFGVRVAALPAAGLAALRFERTWALVDELVHTSRRLSEEGETICAALYRLIGEGRRPELKPLLVGARRAVFAGRRPDRMERVLTAVPDEVAEWLRDWMTCLERRTAGEAELAEALAAEQADKAGLLRQLAADKGFRRGLFLSSPTLSAEVSKWLACPQAVPRRQVLLRLARYVARATVKTSPFATFVISGLGRWADQDGTVIMSGEPVTVPELDLRVVRRRWAQLARQPELAGAVEVGVNASVTEENGRLLFLGAGAGEPLRSMPAEPALLELLAYVRAADRTLHAVRERATPDAVERLLELGLLELRRPFADQATDPLGELAAWLAGALAPGSPETLTALPQMLNELRQPGTNANGHAPAWIGEPLRPEGSHLETAVAPGVMALCGRRAWQPVLNDLQAVRLLLGPLDPDLPAKLAAARFFLHRYGRTGSPRFLSFYRDTHTSAPQLRALLHNRLGPPADLSRLRRDLWDALYAAPEDLHGVIAADPALLTKLASGWPRYISPPGSIACYLQQIDDDHVVLNTVYSGYGRGTGRIRHLLARAGAPVPPADSTPGIAECLGSFGTNLNLRPPTATAIDYPFTVTEARLPLADLRVGYDPATLRLILTDGTRPMHLGMTSELTLPPALAFLIKIFGEPPLAMGPAWQRGGRPEGVSRRPRLRLGRVVLARACWRLHAAEVPLPAKGENEAAYLVRLALWLDRQAIPRRFFARVISPTGRGKDRKPVYVDTVDHFLLLSFTRSISGPGDLVVLEEALPDPASCDSRVAEFVMEVSR